MPNVIDKNAEQLENLRATVGLKAAVIIREQEQIIEASNRGIDRLNKDLKALKRRLEPKMEGPYDETYNDLKDRYTNKLSERKALQDARVVAEESIAASKLYVIPGEFDRGSY